MKKPRITRHAVERFCERCRRDLDPSTHAGYVAGFMALGEMIDRGTWREGNPPWHRYPDDTGRYIDVGGHIAIMLSLDNTGPGYCARTVLIRPAEFEARMLADGEEEGERVAS